MSRSGIYKWILLDINFGYDVRHISRIMIYNWMTSEMDITRQFSMEFSAGPLNQQRVSPEKLSIQVDAVCSGPTPSSAGGFQSISIARYMDSIWIDIASVSLVAVTKVNHHFDFSFTTPRFSYVFIAHQLPWPPNWLLLDHLQKFLHAFPRLRAQCFMFFGQAQARPKDPKVRVTLSHPTAIIADGNACFCNAAKVWNPFMQAIAYKKVAHRTKTGLQG